MRVLGSVALIGLFLSILDASAASADQCPARDSPIATDRPDVTNSSLVVPQGSFQSENGINFSQRSGNHEFDGTREPAALGHRALPGSAGRPPHIFCCRTRFAELGIHECDTGDQMAD